MTRSLVEYVDHVLPGNAFDGLLALLIHEHCAPETVAVLGLPRPDLDRRWLAPLIAMGHAHDELGDRAAAIRGLSIVSGRLLLQGLLLTYRGPQRTNFRIPTALLPE